MEALTLDKIGALNEAIADMVRTETKGHAIMVPAAAAIESTEKFSEVPRFHRHAFSTERLTDFVAYVADNTKNLPENVNPTAYVKPDGKGAFAVLDHGNPGLPLWGHHSAELKLREAPAWIAAQAISQGIRPQQLVIDWLEDWDGSISACAQDGSAIEFRRAITALRRIKLEAKAQVVKVEGDFNRAQSSLESIDASGDGEALPAYFVLHSPLYVGTLTHDIVLRLGVRENDGKPALALRIVGREVLQERTAAWLEEQIQQMENAEKVSVYVGELKLGKP